MGKSSSADNSMSGVIFAVSIVMLILPRATRLVQTSPMSHPELPHITPFRSEQGIAESMIRHTILPPRNGFDEHTRLNTARRHGALPAVGYRGPVLQRPSTIFQLQWTTDQVEDGDEDNGGYGKLHLQRCEHMDLLIYHSCLTDLLHCSLESREGRSRPVHENSNGNGGNG